MVSKYIFEFCMDVEQKVRFMKDQIDDLNMEIEALEEDDNSE